MQLNRWEFVISVEMQDVRSCLLFVANAVMGQSTCKWLIFWIFDSLSLSKKIILEEVPRLSAWPTQFSQNHATEDNIALLFCKRLRKVYFGICFCELKCSLSCWHSIHISKFFYAAMEETTRDCLNAWLRMTWLSKEIWTWLIY